MLQPFKKHFVDTFAFMATQAKLPLSEVEIKTDSIRVTTGVNSPFFNGVFLKGTLSKKDLENQINFYNKKGLPFCIWQESDLRADLLESYQFKKLGEMTMVGCQMSDCKPLNFSKKEIQIKKITSFEEASLWAALQKTSFGYEANEEHFFIKLIMNSLENSDIAYYIAYLNEKAVGSSMVYITEFQGIKVSSLWNGAVLPEARKKGVGSAMANKRIEFAASKKADLMGAYLMPDKMALGYCNAIGMKELYKIYPYLSPGSKD